MGKRLTKEQFVENAVKVHGNRYIYDKTTYKNRRGKSTITCRIHGDFIQILGDHMDGAGCPMCGKITARRKIKSTTEEFTKKAELLHKGKYNYSNVKYINKSTRIKIICKEHGEFLQTPDSHLMGHGCYLCGRKITEGAKTLNTDAFIKMSTEVHGDRYDYSLVNYTNSKTDVRIICKDHGIFWQQAGNHLKGTNCPTCAESGFNRRIDGYVYLLESDSMFKIGITNLTPRKRLTSINKTSFEQFSEKWSIKTCGEICRNVENTVLRMFRKFSKRPTVKFDGYTECFYKDRPMDEIVLLVEALVEYELKSGD